MDIIESWEDQNRNHYAIVRHAPQDQVTYHQKAYEAMWLDEEGQLWSFGGSVGYAIADFDAVEQARDFLLKGISECDTNPEIWLDMVAV